jgi:ribulose-phosphate 3-epimerase
MNDPILLAASLLSSDLARLDWSMKRVASAVDYIHCDVMDGHFVDNLTFGAPVIKYLKRHSPLPLDVHLMIEEPGRWVGSYLGDWLAKGDYLTFHIEAEPDPVESLRSIRKKGVGAGISIKPNTPADQIKSLKHEVDQVLVMSVEPGFGGQPFIEEVLPKITEIRSAFPPNVIVAVDGGIAPDTIGKAAKAGARLIIAGKAIYGEPRPRKAANQLRAIAEQAITAE